MMHLEKDFWNSDHDSTFFFQYYFIFRTQERKAYNGGGSFYDSQILKKRVIFQNSTQPETER